MIIFKMYLIEWYLHFKNKDRYLEIQLSGLKLIQNTPPQNLILPLLMSLSFISPNHWSMIITQLFDKTNPSLPPLHRSVNGGYSNSISPYQT